jgi:deoxyribodipyrimidine photo-lyase
MVAASFLVKHLLIDYRWGEAHYLKYLTDGDWAINNLSWQWCASTGCDAQPYFRIFNPTLQGQRFDPTGQYVQRWVPELRNLTAKQIHAPWTVPAQEREAAARNYPTPIVEHGPARDRFLAAAKQHLQMRASR